MRGKRCERPSVQGTLSAKVPRILGLLADGEETVEVTPAAAEPDDGEATLAPVPV